MEEPPAEQNSTQARVKMKRECGENEEEEEEDRIQDTDPESCEPAMKRARLTCDSDLAPSSSQGSSSEDTNIGNDHISKLSLEILCQILKCLSLYDVVKLESLSHKFQRAVLLHLRVRQKLDLCEGEFHSYMPYSMNDLSLMRLLKRCPDLKHLYGLHPVFVAKRRQRGSDSLSVPGIIAALSVNKSLIGVETSDIFVLEAIITYMPKIEIIGVFRNRNGRFPIPMNNKLNLCNAKISTLDLCGVVIPELPCIGTVKHLYLKWVKLTDPNPFKDFVVPMLQTFIMSNCAGPTNPLKYVPLITGLAGSRWLNRLQLIRVPFLGGLIQHVVEDSWRIRGFRQLQNVVLGACKHALEVDLGYLIITCSHRLEELSIQPSLTKDSLFSALTLAEVDFLHFETLHLGLVDPFPEPGKWTNEQLMEHGLADMAENPAMVTDIGLKAVGQVFTQMKQLTIYNCPHLHYPTAWFTPGVGVWSRLKELHLRRCHAIRLHDFCQMVPQLPAIESIYLEMMFREPPKGCSRVGLSAGTGLGVSSALVSNNSNDGLNQDGANNNAPGAANQNEPAAEGVANRADQNDDNDANAEAGAEEQEVESRNSGNASQSSACGSDGGAKKLKDSGAGNSSDKSEEKRETDVGENSGTNGPITTQREEGSNTKKDQKSEKSDSSKYRTSVVFGPLPSTSNSESCKGSPGGSLPNSANLPPRSVSKMPNHENDEDKDSQPNKKQEIEAKNGANKDDDRNDSQSSKQQETDSKNAENNDAKHGDSPPSKRKKMDHENMETDNKERTSKVEPKTIVKTSDEEGKSKITEQEMTARTGSEKGNESEENDRLNSECGSNTKDAETGNSDIAPGPSGMLVSLERRTESSGKEAEKNEVTKRNDGNEQWLERTCVNESGSEKSADSNKGAKNSNGSTEFVETGTGNQLAELSIEGDSDEPEKLDKNTATNGSDSDGGKFGVQKCACCGRPVDPQCIPKDPPKNSPESKIRSVSGDGSEKCENENDANDSVKDSSQNGDQSKKELKNSTGSTTNSTNNLEESREVAQTEGSKSTSTSVSAVQYSGKGKSLQGKKKGLVKKSSKGSSVATGNVVNQSCQAVCEEIRETTRKAKESSSGSAEEESSKTAEASTVSGKSAQVQTATNRSEESVEKSSKSASTSPARPEQQVGSKPMSSVLVGSNPSGNNSSLTSQEAKEKNKTTSTQTSRVCAPKGLPSPKKTKPNMIDKSTSTSDPVMEEDTIQVMTIKSASLMSLKLYMVGITDLVIQECPKFYNLSATACRVLKNVSISQAPCLHRVNFKHCQKLDHEKLVKQTCQQEATKDRIIILRPMANYDPVSMERWLFQSNYDTSMTLIHDLSMTPDDTIYNRLRAEEWLDLVKKLEEWRSKLFSRLPYASRKNAALKYPWGRDMYRMIGSCEEGYEYEVMSDLPWVRTLSGIPEPAVCGVGKDNHKRGLFCCNLMDNSRLDFYVNHLLEDMAERNELQLPTFPHNTLVYVNMCDLDGPLVPDRYV